jgi:hypothetical protein
MKVFRSLRTCLFLGCAAPMLLCAQSTTQGDLPRQPPGSQHPDLQQQTSPKKDQRGTPSNDSTAGPSGTSDTSKDAQSKKKSKKNHNRQTHGPQRHDPNGQS